MELALLSLITRFCRHYLDIYLLFIMSAKIFATIVSALSALALVAAETHTVSFSNKCGYGTVSTWNLGLRTDVLTHCLI